MEDLGFYTADVYWSTWKDTVWAKVKSVGAQVDGPFDEESLGILTIFFHDLPIPLPEVPVGLGNGNEGSFFFFKASPEKTRT